MILNMRWMIGQCIRIIPLSILEEWWWGRKMETGMDEYKRQEIDEEKMVNDTLTRAERMVSGFEGI